MVQQQVWLSLIACFWSRLLRYFCKFKVLIIWFQVIDKSIVESWLNWTCVDRIVLVQLKMVFYHAFGVGVVPCFEIDFVDFYLPGSYLIGGWRDDLWIKLGSFSDSRWLQSLLSFKGRQRTYFRDIIESLSVIVRVVSSGLWLIVIEFFERRRSLCLDFCATISRLNFT